MNMQIDPPLKQKVVMLSCAKCTRQCDDRKNKTKVRKMIITL